MRKSRFEPHLYGNNNVAQAWYFSRTKDILDKLPENEPCTFVEIGVNEGKLIRPVLELLPESVYLGIDAWGDMDFCRYEKTGDDVVNYSQDHFDETKERATEIIKLFPGRAYLMHATGEVAAERIKSGKVCKSIPQPMYDLVYIDAEHSYEGVVGDIKAWYPTVKDGGWLGGHDYHTKGHHAFPGVDRAVDETFGHYVKKGKMANWWVKMTPEIHSYLDYYFR